MTWLLRRLGLRRLAGARDGAAATEFAIIFPAFFFLFFGLLEVAHVLWVINTLQYVVAQGARFATTNSANPPTAASTCGSSIGTYETNVQSNLNKQIAFFLPAASAPLPTGSCTAGTPATVTLNLRVTYPFTSLLTSLFPSGITLQQKATVTLPIN